MTEPENQPKNRGGRPRKPGKQFNFYLATDVAKFLDGLNPDGGKGEQTKFVEDAVRKAAKLPTPKP